MHFEILQRRRRENARDGPKSAFVSQMLNTPLVVMAAKQAFKRGATSKKLEIRAQLVSAHGMMQSFPGQSLAYIICRCPHECLSSVSHCIALQVARTTNSLNDHLDVGSQACGKFHDEDRLLDLLIEAKTRHEQNPNKRRQSLFTALKSLLKGSRTESSREDAGSTEVMEFSETRRRNTCSNSVRQQGENMVQSMMVRNHEMYGIHNFEFESIDAEKMQRNRTGAMTREVTVNDSISLPTMPKLNDSESSLRA